MLESALYNILRAILRFIRVLFCYADKSSELCKVMMTYIVNFSCGFMKSFEMKDAGVQDQTFVNLLTNGGFKAFFGDENNKAEVKEVINSLLPEHCRVVEIEYLPTEHQGQVVDENKTMHYDYMCRDKSGAIFIVEMQQYKEKHWFKRCVSYACRSYDRQNHKGKEYDVPPVFLIGLMGVDVDHVRPELWENRFVSEYTFREKSTNEVLADTIFVIFAELAKFKKGPDECLTKQDQMLYILKNSGSFTENYHPIWDDFEALDSILKKMKIAGFDEVKRMQYEKDMYDERRRYGEIAAAREEGLEQGLEQGRKEASLMAAKNLKALGVAVDVISQSTGLTVEEIEKL